MKILLTSSFKLVQKERAIFLSNDVLGVYKHRYRDYYYDSNGYYVDSLKLRDAQGFYFSIDYWDLLVKNDS